MAVLDIKQISDIFYTLICQLLNIDPKNSNGKVRKSWPKDGAPGWAIDDDIVFFRVVPDNDPYIQQKEVQFNPNTQSTASTITSYTRAYKVHFVLYGPSSYPNSDTIKDGLLSDATASSLGPNNLYIKTDITALMWTKELFNSEWWERTDFEAGIYELVTKTGTIPVIQSVNVQVKTEGGVTENANTTT